jgi:hypothetical protein
MSTTTTPRPFLARFAGECAHCGHDIEVGDKIVKGIDGYIHANMSVCHYNAESDAEAAHFDRQSRCSEIMGFTDDCPF